MWLARKDYSYSTTYNDYGYNLKTVYSFAHQRLVQIPIYSSTGISWTKPNRILHSTLIDTSYINSLRTGQGRTIRDCSQRNFRCP